MLGRTHTNHSFSRSGAADGAATHAYGAFLTLDAAVCVMHMRGA